MLVTIQLHKMLRVVPALCARIQRRNMMLAFPCFNDPLQDGVGM